MKRILSFVVISALVVAACLCLAGCGSNEKAVGKWSCYGISYDSARSFDKFGATTDLEVKSNSTATMTIKLENAALGKIEDTFTFEWEKLDDNQDAAVYHLKLTDSKATFYDMFAADFTISVLHFENDNTLYMNFLQGSGDGSLDDVVLGFNR